MLVTTQNLIPGTLIWQPKGHHFLILKRAIVGSYNNLDVVVFDLTSMGVREVSLNRNYDAWNLVAPE